MHYLIEGRVVLELEHLPGMKTSKHIATSFNLDLKSLDPKTPIDMAAYLDAEDLPTAAGTKALTNVFIQGLVGNIHHAQKQGYWVDSDHIRYIIDELQRGFVAIPTVEKDIFPTLNT